MKQLAATLFSLRIWLGIAEERIPWRRGELVFVDFIYDPRRRRGGARVTTTSFESHRDLFSDNSESTYQTSDVCLGLWPRFDDGLSSADLHIPNRSFATLSRIGSSCLVFFSSPRHIPLQPENLKLRVTRTSWEFFFSKSGSVLEVFRGSNVWRIHENLDNTREARFQTNLGFNALFLSCIMSLLISLLCIM